MLSVWGFYFILHTAHQHNFYDALQHSTIQQFGRWLLTLFYLLIFPVMAVIFGVAWWKIWKEKIAARGWGIAASLTYVLVPLLVMIQTSKSEWTLLWVELTIGVVGLIAFSPRPRKGLATDEIRPEDAPS